MTSGELRLSKHRHPREFSGEEMQVSLTLTLSGKEKTWFCNNKKKSSHRHVFGFRGSCRAATTCTVLTPRTAGKLFSLVKVKFVTFFFFYIFILYIFHLEAKCHLQLVSLALVWKRLQTGWRTAVKTPLRSRRRASFPVFPVAVSSYGHTQHRHFLYCCSSCKYCS